MSIVNIGVWNPFHRPSLRDILTSRADLKSLVDQLSAHGLADAVFKLRNGVIVAPTNSAFAALTEVPENIGDILKYHVSTKEFAGMWLNNHTTLLDGKSWTCNGTTITIGNGVEIKIKEAVKAGSGNTILLVDSILTPQVDEAKTGARTMKHDVEFNAHGHRVEFMARD